MQISRTTIGGFHIVKDCPPIGSGPGLLDVKPIFSQIYPGLSKESHLCCFTHYWADRFNCYYDIMINGRTVMTEIRCTLRISTGLRVLPPFVIFPSADPLASECASGFNADIRSTITLQPVSQAQGFGRI